MYKRQVEYLSTCQLVDYDPIDKKATFLLTMSQWEQQKIADGEITLTIRQLLSQQTVYDHRPIDIVCSTLPLDSETQVVALSGFIGEEHKMQETVPVSYTHLDVYKRQSIGIEP